MLRSGERQVAAVLSDIRADHVARYTWAADRLKGYRHVVDAACGCGYGTATLFDGGVERVTGIDIDADAILYAADHWNRPGIAWMTQDLGGARPLPACGAVVSFETIEHVEDPLPFLKAARAASPVLLASVPNEEVVPKIEGRYRHHFRHYTREEFRTLLYRAGWNVTEWWGQADNISPVERGRVGRTIVVEAI